MQLAGAGVGEHQRQVVPELTSDQAGHCSHVRLAHSPVRVRVVRGEVRRIDAVGGAYKADVLVSGVEVLRLAEQLPDYDRPLRRRRAEDLLKARFESGCVFAVWIGMHYTPGCWFL